MTDDAERARWQAMCAIVADNMKVFTRPFVTMLASPAGGQVDIGSGTFLESDGCSVLTCEHVAKMKPDGLFKDANADYDFKIGSWRSERDPHKDVAIAPVPATEWSRLPATAHPLSIAKFAQKHSPVENELLFFRGISGENAHITGFGSDIIPTGYCSQEKKQADDVNIFEILWGLSKTVVTPSTDSNIQKRVKYNNPAGYSGSLVWNTRFVELGGDFSKWSPDEARVTGLLRRYDPDTETLLVWRVEHLRAWL